MKTLEQIANGNSTDPILASFEEGVRQGFRKHNLRLPWTVQRDEVRDYPQQQQGRPVWIIFDSRDMRLAQFEDEDVARFVVLAVNEATT